MGKLPIKFVASGLFLFCLIGLAVWQLGSYSTMSGASNDTQALDSVIADSQASVPVTNAVGGSLVSKVEPLDQSEWLQNRAITSNSDTLSGTDSLDLERRFERANELFEQNDARAAEPMYRDLIRDFPKFVEPYVNLAALQARNGDLVSARETLMQATEVNPSTKLLFASINQVHGALAAKAYRSALETDANSISDNTDLPKAQDLVSDFRQAQKIFELNNLLAQAKQTSLSAKSEALKELSVKLNSAQSEIALLKEQGAESMQGLRADLQLEKEKNKLMTNQLEQLQRSAEQQDSDLVAKLRIELSNAESAAVTMQDTLSKLSAENDALNLRLAASQQADTTDAVITVATITESPASDLGSEPAADEIPAEQPQVETNIQRQVAIELVRAWAQAWSQQDVTSYVAFYLDGYSPSSRLSHQQWRAQRQVRLTNKRFIQVKVSDFDVRKTGNGFSVVFSQHYRSDTLDDTIKKRLSFVVDSADWSAAKIVKEDII